MFRSQIALQTIDLHLHTTFSDGTDTPEELLDKVSDAGLDLFSITDHDDIAGCVRMWKTFAKRDDPKLPRFLSGVEFSCRDALGKYHVLGYGYDPTHSAIRAMVNRCHSLRLDKLLHRLSFLEDQFGFSFSAEERASLSSLPNPGKPHIAHLMMKHGYVKDIKEAISCIDQHPPFHSYILSEEVLDTIIASGGIAVLAHPWTGNGTQQIAEEEMEPRLLHLKEMGLAGVEAYYPVFSPEQREILLALANRHNLMVTAGSDYHGRNKKTPLGKTGLATMDKADSKLLDFLHCFQTRGYL